MAEKLVENQVCENCGADIRLNALFCYNCGFQVASDEEIAAEQNNEKVSSAWFKDSISEVKVAEKPIVGSKSEKQQSKEKSNAGLPAKSIGLAKVKTPKTEEKTETEPLKTAASLRKRPNPLLKKKVEVKWETPQSAPNIWFLVVSIILALFAVGILFAMLYIR